MRVKKHQVDHSVYPLQPRHIVPHGAFYALSRLVLKYFLSGITNSTCLQFKLHWESQLFSATKHCRFAMVSLSEVFLSNKQQNTHFNPRNKH